MVHATGPEKYFRALSGLPGNLPGVTGACRETLLGAVYPVPETGSSSDD